MNRVLVLVAVATAGALLAFALRHAGSAGRAPPRRAAPVAGGEDEPVRVARARGEAPAVAAGPSFARLSTAKVAQDDPRASDYDAIHLEQMTDASNFELFAREPRDEAWAGSMERALDDVVTEGLATDFAGAEVASIECRTQSCAIAVGVDDARARALYRYMQAYMLLGSSIEPEFGELADGRRTLEFAVLYDKRLGDGDGYASWRRGIVTAQQAEREQLRLHLLGAGADR